MSPGQFARRAFRLVFPRRQHPLLDAPESLEPADVAFAAAYEQTVREEFPDGADPFVAERYREGRRWRHVVSHFLRGSEKLRVLDVGGGNGAIELAFAASPRFTAASVEQLWNRSIVVAHQRAAAPVRRTLGDATNLPFPDATFDAVLFLETLEHVPDPRAVGSEIERVLRAGGIVLITTPPRWRYAMKPDPHFGIRGLVMLPPFLQRKIAARRGYDGPEHYVDRIYSSVRQIRRCFPNCEIAAVLSRSRSPSMWFWDAIVLRRVV